MFKNLYSIQKKSVTKPVKDPLILMIKAFNIKGFNKKKRLANNYT